MKQLLDLKEMTVALERCGYSKMYHHVEGLNTTGVYFNYIQFNNQKTLFKHPYDSSEVTIKHNNDGDISEIRFLGGLYYSKPTMSSVVIEIERVSKLDIRITILKSYSGNTLKFKYWTDDVYRELIAYQDCIGNEWKRTWGVDFPFQKPLSLLDDNLCEI